jgi:hypothetical protein
VAGFPGRVIVGPQSLYALLYGLSRWVLGVEEIADEVVRSDHKVLFSSGWLLLSPLSSLCKSE